MPHCEYCYRILANDGGYHWHLVRAVPFRDEHGTVISWYGIHTDINALKEVERELQAREHQLQGIIETVPSMFLSASPDGKPLHINIIQRYGLSVDIDERKRLKTGFVSPMQNLIAPRGLPQWPSCQLRSRTNSTSLLWLF